MQLVLGQLKYQLISENMLQPASNNVLSPGRQPTSPAPRSSTLTNASTQKREPGQTADPSDQEPRAPNAVAATVSLALRSKVLHKHQKLTVNHRIEEMVKAKEQENVEKENVFRRRKYTYRCRGGSAVLRYEQLVELVERRLAEAKKAQEADSCSGWEELD